MTMSNGPNKDRSTERPSVLLIGGPDVDARLDLMFELRDRYDVRAAGTATDLEPRFREASFGYDFYPLGRGANPLSDLRAFISLVRVCKERRPDVIHTFDTKPCVFGRLAARVAKVPVIVGTIPGLGTLYVKKDIVTRLVRFVYERLQKSACAVADITVFQNGEDRKEFIGRGLIHPRKATVIPGSGVKTDRFVRSEVVATMSAKLRRELGIARDAVVVTMVSRLIRSKGVMEYAAAAEELKEDCPQARFILVGSYDSDSADPLSPSELKWVAERVQCLGKRTDIPVILAASDVFALPSFYREGIPRSLLEAASMSLPLITTDWPGCNEVVRDGVNGFMVPTREVESLARAVRRLVVDSALRERFGRASRKLAVSRFDLSVIAHQIDTLYHELLAQKRQAQRDSSSLPVEKWRPVSSS